MIQLFILDCLCSKNCLMKIKSLFPISSTKLSQAIMGPSPIQAGFPSPAENYMDASLDLNKELIRHPSATFFVKVEGDSMQGAGIMNGDILIVDRSLAAISNSVVVAIVDGEFTVKRYKLLEGEQFLYAENPAYQEIKISTLNDFSIWGVVTYAIHALV